METRKTLKLFDILNHIQFLNEGHISAKDGEAEAAVVQRITQYVGQLILEKPGGEEWPVKTDMWWEKEK